MAWPPHTISSNYFKTEKKKPSDFIFFNAVKHTFVIVRVLQKRMIKHLMKTKTPQKREDKSVIYTLIWKLACGETETILNAVNICFKLLCLQPTNQPILMREQNYFTKWWFYTNLYFFFLMQISMKVHA